MAPARAYSYPPSNAPRTWLITSAASPIGLRLSRALLEHGDNLVLAAPSEDLEAAPTPSHEDMALDQVDDGPRREPRAVTFARFLAEDVVEGGWKDRVRVVGLDGRVGQSQAAVAEAVETYGGLDILFCCSSEAVIGTVEELSASERAMTLVREQFETNVFGPINCIKAALPAMREKKCGHIMVMTGITSHLGTPGLGMFCASGWAIEGFCDSLTYEIAPFNIKLTIVQPSYEIPVLTNKVSAAPALSQYAPSSGHSAPLARAMLGRLIDRIEHPQSLDDNEGSFIADAENYSDSTSPNGQSDHNSHDKTYSLFSDPVHTHTVFPALPEEMLDSLVAETVHALTTIGGHENPPARHIVGHEGVESVKEKLKTVSEELEDFVECSGAVDLEPGDIIRMLSQVNVR